MKLSEKEHIAVEWIKSKTKNVNHSGSTFFEHLFNTFLILKNKKQSEDCCLAGLYHSVYGTEAFEVNLYIDEKEVIDVIGEYANELVKVFCSKDRDAKIIVNYEGMSKTMQYDLLNVQYANYIEQADRIGKSNERFINSIKNKILELEKIGE